MRQVLPDTSPPLLRSWGATLTSQRLILHLFLPVSLSPRLPHLSRLALSPPVPHSFTHTPHQIHKPEADSRLELQTQLLCPPPLHPTRHQPPFSGSSSSSLRTSKLTLAGVRYQYKVSSKGTLRKKIFTPSVVRWHTNLSFGTKG